MDEKQVLLNSMDRDKDLSNGISDFTIKFKSGIQNKYENMKVKHVAIPNSFYTITQYNNRIDFFENALNKVATLDVGYYDETDICTEIKAKLDAASGGFNVFTVTVNNNNKRITIAAPNNFRLLFLSGSYASSTNELWRMLGFVQNHDKYDTVNANSHTGNIMINLSFPLSFYILITIDGIQINNITISKELNRNITYLIPNKYAFGQIIYFDESNFLQELNVSNFKTIRDIKFQVLYYNGAIASLHQDWEILLSFK